MTIPDWEQVQARMAAGERFIAERGGQRWIDTFISPLYLDWMQLNLAQRDGISFAQIAKVRARAAELSLDEIAVMLGMQWRVQVMGAWYAIARADDTLASAVHDGFEWCFGSLTSAALATAALTYRTDDTQGVLRGYLTRSLEAGHGDEAIVEAALRRLQPHERTRVPSRDDEALTRLLTVAGALRASAS